MEKDYEKKVKRSAADKKEIIKRLRIMIGQINAVIRLADDNAFCDDLLIQILAIRNAAKSLANFIIERHITTCVTENLKVGNLDVLNELNNIYKRFQ